MIDTFEHVLLFAICILIMRLSLPVASLIDGPITQPISYEKTHVTDVADAAISTSFAAAMAVPLWVALEVIWWGTNALLA